MTADEFSSLSLGPPETTEAVHMGQSDFRVAGRIFATLWPDDEWGMVKLAPDEQEVLVAAHPEIFEPVQGGWGRQGATKVRLRAARKSITRQALVMAWRQRAPKRLSGKLKSR